MAEDEWVDDPSPDGDWVDDDKIPSTSKLESAVRGLGQGASLGFWDELAGAGEAIGQSIGIKGLGEDLGKGDGLSFVKPLALDPDRDFSQAYTEGRDKWRGEDKQARADNPATFTGGELGGSVASSFIPGLNVAKGATLANIAGKAALQGGLSGLGNSEADNIQDLAMDTGKNAAIGGAVGGTLGYVAPKVGEGLDWAKNKIADKTDDLAERFAGRALGAERGTIKKLGIDKVKAAGRQALDEGVLSPLANTDDLISRTAALKKTGGEMMGQAYNAIDDAGKSTFNPMEAAQAVDEQLGGFYRSPLNRGEAQQFDNTLEAIKMRAPSKLGGDAGDVFIPLTEAQGLKEELGRAANWKNNPKPTEKELMAREAYRIVNRQIDAAVASGEEAIESAGLKDVLKKGKELFGRASDAETLLGNKQAREQGNKILGLTDWGVLGAGGVGAAVTGGASIPGTLGLIGAKKGLEKYGSQNAALGLDQVSKLLMKSPKMAELYNSNPQAFSALATKMAQKVMPDKKESRPFEKDALLQKTQGTKYAQVFQNASKRGDKAVGAANFVLQSTDPEYRKMMLGDEEEQN